MRCGGGNITFCDVLQFCTCYIAFKWCINCSFGARCYVQARPMPSCGVCPSVTFVYCVQTATDTAMECE